MSSATPSSDDARPVDLDTEGATSDAASTDGLIRPLPETLASKIAAGEVVQRPANVVKELVENSLDAGASEVEIIVKRAGSALIHVVDDGGGMGPRDARACLNRHATSKLRAFDDLERLATLGFRGEALASIASVSQVDLKTRRRGDEAGVMLRVEGGEVLEERPCQAPEGTSLAVANLFFNVPARRAFLKTPATEFKHIVDAFRSLALSHPSVAFRLVHDDNEVYRLPSAKGGAEIALRQRIRDLLGADTAEALVPVAETTSYLGVHGLVAGPDAARKSRGEQHLFVNDRVVKSRALNHAVASAFGGLLPEDHYPFFALFLQVDPRHVDVNVHPTKTEVKFDDGQGVYSFVKAVVKKGLAEAGLGVSFQPPSGAVDFSSGGGSSRDGATSFAEGEHSPPTSRPPSLSGPTSRAAGSGAPSPSEVFPLEAGVSRGDSVSSSSGSSDEDAVAGDGSALPFGPPARLEKHSEVSSGTKTSSGRLVPALSEAGPAGFNTEDSRRSIWQLHGRYLLTPIRSGLLIVDQRAAHERILYERTLAAMEGGLGASQQLLFPYTLEVEPDTFALLEELLPDLKALGFEILLSAPREARVHGVPLDVRTGDEQRVLTDMIEQYQRNQHNLRLDAQANMARTFAKRNALQEGTTLHPESARSLIDQLFACEQPLVTPAGRRTHVKVSESTIARFFQQGG